MNEKHRELAVRLMRELSTLDRGQLIERCLELHLELAELDELDAANRRDAALWREHLARVAAALAGSIH
jgi:hypothetical protein